MSEDKQNKKPEPEPIKYADIGQLRKDGVIQEMNRRFLHPLGMAIEVILDEDNNGVEKLGGIWDYRKDPEGIYFDLANRTEDQVATASKKAASIDDMMEHKAEERIKLLGDIIEPIPGEGSSATVSADAVHAVYQALVQRGRHAEAVLIKTLLPEHMRKL